MYSRNVVMDLSWLPAIKILGIITQFVADGGPSVNGHLMVIQPALEHTEATSKIQVRAWGPVVAVVIPQPVQAMHSPGLAGGVKVARFAEPLGVQTR